MSPTKRGLPTPAADAARNPAALQAELRDRLGRPVLLMLTDNASRFASARETRGALTVRLHRSFLDAPEEVLSELVDWLGGRSRSTSRMRAHFTNRAARTASESRSPPRAALRSRGHCHDLAALREGINRRYLDGRSRATVAWGRKPRPGPVRSVRLGTYDPVRNHITISRRLDRPEIPRYMVEYVLFHEMLHEVLGIGERADGRRDIHGRLFKLMEETFPDYARARRFERRRWG
jgi:hypothetical protein